MKMMMDTIKFTDKLLLNILKTITIIAFVLITLLVTATIIGRYIRVSFLWSDEIIELLFAYLVFYGSAALWISKGHFSAGDWIERKLVKDERARHLYRLLLEFMVLVFVVVFFYFSLKLTLFTAAVTNVLAIPKRVFYSCMPISGAIMIIYSIRNVVIEIINIRKSTSHNAPTSKVTL
jgi:TRAP-type transport system small permease protein